MVDDPAAFAGRLGGGARACSRSTGCCSTRRRVESRRGAIRCRLLVAITRDAAATAEAVLARWRDPWAGILTSAGAAEQSGLSRARRIDAGALLGADRRAAGGHRPAAGAADGDASTSRSRGAPRRGGRGGRCATSSCRSRRCGALRRPRSGRRSRRRTRRRSTAPSRRRWPAVGRVGEPIDVAVATPQGRIRVESLQTVVRHISTEVAEHIGPEIGVTSGFNALDGD